MYLQDLPVYKFVIHPFQVEPDICTTHTFSMELIHVAPIFQFIVQTHVLCCLHTRAVM
jgi:hypothetical protein